MSGEILVTVIARKDTYSSFTAVLKTASLLQTSVFVPYIPTEGDSGSAKGSALL